jgi:hypothetical protein
MINNKVFAIKIKQTLHATRTIRINLLAPEKKFPLTKKRTKNYSLNHCFKNKKLKKNLLSELES